MCIWAIFNRWDGSLIHKIALRNRVHKEHTPPMQVIAYNYGKMLKLSAYPTPNTDYQEITAKLSANYPQLSYT